MLNYIIWDWNPDIFTLGFLKIRYYGLLFAGGFALGYYILKKIFEKEGTDIAWLDSLLMYVLAGTVIGSRLGHCLFYEPDYYLSHPLEILKVWKGGLASHGGAFGIIIALWFYSRKVSHKSMMWSLDRLLIVVALSGCMIRMGNLANSEIYGRPTGSSFGFVHITDSYFGRYIKDESIDNR
jgi:phosphatidylglycerol:prolipoprotein diacylglycerol transferase